MHGAYMIGHAFHFCGCKMHALASGALFWPAQGTLCVADLHLGKAQRPALAGGAALPPYDVRDTLARLQSDLHLTGACRVAALGDSFDDARALDRLSDPDRKMLQDIVAGTRWLWVRGNHDPHDPGLGNTALSEAYLGPLVLRHIADPNAKGEISGHYHPKVRLPVGRGGRAAFLVDEARIILPAYGSYAGGLWADDPVLCLLMSPRAIAILTDRTAPPDTTTLMRMPLSPTRASKRINTTRQS